MNILERAGVAIRHAPALERADWLWDRVRPAYDRMLETVARSRGLERVINGTDRFRLSARSRGFVAEVYEPAVWGRVTREVRPGDNVAEVGANIGLYALAFAGRVGAAGHVVAFEPDPVNASALEANVSVNGWHDRITVIKAAVGHSSGQVSFAAARGVESRIDTGHNCGDAITVPMVTLDDALRGRRIDVIKIDVEGFEQQVIQGARRVLTEEHRRPRAILVEVHPYAWADLGTTTSASFLRLLDEMGYRVEDMICTAVSGISEYGHVIALRK
ncbi:MAG: FkbM family methyltransferase [Candidatus Binatus sp.]